MAGVALFTLIGGLTALTGWTTLQGTASWFYRLLPLIIGLGIGGLALVLRDRYVLRRLEESHRMHQDLRQREQALKTANEFQRKLLRTVATAIFTVDADQRITSVNEEFCETIGFTEQELVGQRCDILKGHPCLEKCGLFDPNRTSPIVKKECAIHHKDGRRMTILKSAEVIRDEMGRVTGGIESFVDVTALVKARKAAEQLNASKTMFLANMSHEIRTPMNGIIGMTELALGTELSAEQTEYLQMVKTSADSLLIILNDILDFSKIEAGKLDLTPIPFNLRDSLCEMVGTLAVRAEAKGLELACHIVPETPDAVVGDPGRLRQIVVNLIGNAVKFTETGEVVLRVEPQSVTVEETVLHFAVRDTGIGIPADKQKMIFDAFTQVDGSSARRYEGTGLGLAISAQLAHLMGGQIWVESEPGRGSTFHFTVRLARQKDPVPLPTPGDIVRLRNLPALVVDDNGANRRIVAEILEHWGMQPSEARTGIEALSLIHDRTEAYPLIVLDANMPEMDGFNLVERMRKENRWAESIIMMLSSAGRRGDAARCEKLGIAVYLTKPIRQSELLQAVQIALGIAQKPEEPSRLVTRHVLREVRRKLRILLAEDNPINQKLTKRILEQWGHTVHVANNGQEVMDFLDREPADLILMDVQMPGMGGYEATARIRGREQSTGDHPSSP